MLLVTCYDDLGWVLEQEQVTFEGLIQYLKMIDWAFTSVPAKVVIERVN